MVIKWIYNYVSLLQWAEICFTKRVGRLLHSRRLNEGMDDYGIAIFMTQMMEPLLNTWYLTGNW